MNVNNDQDPGSSRSSLLVSGSGSTRWLLAKGGVLRDEAGGVARVLGVCVDITERRQAAELILQDEHRARERVAELAGIVKVAA
jgi:PAS domain-containing protein